MQDETLESTFKPHLKVATGTDNIDVYIKEGRPHWFKVIDRNLILIMSYTNEVIGYRLRFIKDLI